ncbi:hypothetical protein G6F31_015116 [Rhizopus arrhizus]|nr:hypothetical protein G6F31_015116 [Rhizopus arrhizus]
MAFASGARRSQRGGAQRDEGLRQRLRERLAGFADALRSISQCPARNQGECRPSQRAAFGEGVTASGAERPFNPAPGRPGRHEDDP